MNRTQILEMLQLQAAMNAKVNKSWLAAGYPFLRANVVEGAEAMEHHGWKWWKKQEMDLAQFSMELVDIWHFTLSHCVVRADGNLDLAASIIEGQLEDQFMQHGTRFDGNDYVFSEMTTLDRVELLIGLSVSRRTHMRLFETLLNDAGMTWEDLYGQYVGKNVLNFFRQDRGYKEGLYTKIWAGREDNEHLVEIMGALDPTDPEYAKKLYTQLSVRYAETCPA